MLIPALPESPNGLAISLFEYRLMQFIISQAIGNIFPIRFYSWRLAGLIEGPINLVTRSGVRLIRREEVIKKYIAPSLLQGLINTNDMALNDTSIQNFLYLPLLAHSTTLSVTQEIFFDKTHK